MIFPNNSAFDWSYISLICRYLSLSHTIAKKFAKKRKHAEIDESFDKANDSMDIEEEIPKSQKKKPSKRKFMKPKDEWAQLVYVDYNQCSVWKSPCKGSRSSKQLTMANDHKALLLIALERNFFYMNYTCMSSC